MRLLRSSITFIVIAVLGILLLVMSIKDKIELAKPPANIAEMTEDDFYNGRFVEGDIYEIWNEFATLQESDTIFGITYNTKTTAYYFAMPLETSFYTGIPKFVALSVRDSSDYATAKKMMMESLDYYNNDIELETTMHIKGKISKLKGDGAKRFDKEMSEEGFIPSDVAVHYVINVGNDGSGTTTALLIGIGITVVGVFGTLFSIIRGRARGL